MAVIYINGIPISGYDYGSIDRYFSPHKKHLRDIAEAQDVECEEIYEQENKQEDENNQTMVD